MPVTKSAIIRYRIIDQLLRNRQHRFPSIEFLRSEVEKRLYGESSNSVSQSTIEKDLRAMRSDDSLGINAPICYNKKEKGYYYDDPDFSLDGLSLTEDDLNALRKAAGLLDVFADIPVLGELREAIGKINARLLVADQPDGEPESKYIVFEKPSSTPGSRWIKSIYEAITERRVIHFDYLRIYNSGEIKRRELQPYQLREKNNCWYVIGFTQKHREFTIYALDRIRSMETGETFLRKADFNETLLYQGSVGIMTGTGNPEEVILDISGPHRHRLPLNPLHSSQQMIEESGERTRFRLEVQINEELVSHLLPMCRHLQVIAPEKLKKMIVEELRAGLACQENGTGTSYGKPGTR